MNYQEKVWKMGQYVAIMLIVFLVVLSVKYLKSLGEPSLAINSISVTGKGEALAVPDIATFSVSVNEMAKTVVEAQSNATTKINATIQALKSSGIKEKDIKTTSYTISPHYEYQNVACGMSYCPPGKSVLTGYEVGQTMSVKVRDTSKAGNILTQVGALGVQNVSGLNFSVDDEEAVKTKARNEAIANAKIKAGELAKGLGVKLGKIISFNEGGDMPYYAMESNVRSAKVMVAGAGAVAPEIPAGEQKVVSEVTVVYEIK